MGDMELKLEALTSEKVQKRQTKRLKEREKICLLLQTCSTDKTRLSLLLLLGEVCMTILRSADFLFLLLVLSSSRPLRSALSLFRSNFFRLDTFTSSPAFPRLAADLQRWRRESLQACCGGYAARTSTLLDHG